MGPVLTESKYLLLRYFTGRFREELGICDKAQVNSHRGKGGWYLVRRSASNW